MTKVSIVMGDITDQDTDAIVNAANPSLMGGGGVDGAIHNRGGLAILEECKRIRQLKWPAGLPSGKAVITTGGLLKARYVIHTVGPIWRGGHQNEPKLLSDCYRNSLEIGSTRGLRSIAFPSISTGAYGYPIWEASGIALETVKKYAENVGGPTEVVFVLFSDPDLRIYLEAATRFQ